MAGIRSLALILLGILATQFTAQAQTAPVNDNWANRTTISSLPFTTTEPNMYLATVEGTDPVPPCVPYYTSEAHTLWYSYTTGASTEYLTLTIPNNLVYGMITVYTGAPGAFSIVSGACVSYDQAVGTTQIAGLRLAPNTTYSIKVGATALVQQGDTLTFNVAAATQYHVTTTTDTNDGSCGATCSLRDAISASNANPGAVIIPAGTFTLSIPGGDEDYNQTGDLDAQVGMGIYGAGMTQTIIDANHIDRVLHLDSHGNGSASFPIGDFTLRNGNAVTPGPYGNEFYGGGLLVTSFNEPDYVGIERVVALSNVAYQSGGGFYIAAPGTISDSLISGNSLGASQGYSGGGLEYQGDPTHFLQVSGSTFSGNYSPVFGGGIYAQGNFYISNSTISGNYAGNQGGGIVSEGNAALVMASSTVVFNSASNNTVATESGGGVYFQNSGSVASSITNSIIAKNTVANPSDPPDCAVSSGTFTSSYNLVQYPNTSCHFTGTGDVTGVDPFVSTALAYNGGLTPTHALLTGSPAIDSADPAGCNDAFGTPLAYDQRGVGFPRIVGAACDKGALESPSVTPPGVPVMNPASDSGVSNTDDITNVQTPGFTGTCTTGTTIQLQVDAANVLPTATTCNAGSYAITVTAPIAEGTHAITATANNGSVTSLMSAPLTVTIETTQPVVSLVSSPPNPDSNTNPSFSFTANHAGSTFTCSINGSAFSTCTSPASYGVSLGPNTFKILATDPAGNADTAPLQYLWVVLPPTPSTPVLAPGYDSGLSNSDGITNVFAPFFTGSCEDGEAVELMSSGTQIGSQAGCSSGSYSISAPLVEGSYSISAKAMMSGYTSETSAATAIVIDRTAPQAPTITGPSSLAGATAPIPGTATETDGLITVSEGAATVCTVLGPFASGNWSCTPSFTTGGTHALTATQTDLAGNVSNPSATFDVSIDIIFRNGFE